MIVTLGSLKTVEPVLAKITDTPLPVTVSYKVSRMLKVVVAELAHFDEFRNRLIVKHGAQEVDRPGVYTVTDENMAAFTVEVNELAATQVDLNLPELTIEELERAGDALTLTPRELMLLQDTLMPDPTPVAAVVPEPEPEQQEEQAE